MAKDVFYGEDARRKLQIGVDKLADTVKAPVNNTPRVPNEALTPRTPVFMVVKAATAAFLKTPQTPTFCMSAKNATTLPSRLANAADAAAQPFINPVQEKAAILTSQSRMPFSPCTNGASD